VIETGAGNDAIVVSPAAMNIENVNGLTVNGGVGADALTVHDENNPYELGPNGSVYTVTSSSIHRFAEHVLFDDFVVPVDVEFSAVEAITLAAGNQADEFRVEGEGEMNAFTIDGSSGADRFRVASPAFDALTVHGDAPIFFPGDRMTVNEDGMYAVGTIPGLYPAGAGGATIGEMTIHYTGLEQGELLPQIYGGPGDFDLNGLVNAEDLTHPTLGWRVRFGDDLGGHDFLVWQRNLGANRLPAMGEPSGGAGQTSIDLALATQNAASRSAEESSTIAASYGFENFDQADDRPLRVGENSKQRAQSQFAPMSQGALRNQWTPSTRDVRIVDLALDIQVASDDADASAPPSIWDEAFATWQSHARAAV
jgi:hypothetical protein